ncbi:hypothetical protein BGP77_09885 [Saccharospirillum sp. MSK14-1]|uniref:DUF6436 domain-containing protein n=1 Tax=Saccharospirillum sp. MSK14-1 TaxID=1897632 RepID=UPI000D3D57E3|nr:DUF6436 domain-containing protein [Saccharospirillum sp. MSK14-1]PTY39049.1 hypothetical protein BGP77_09885 [Saccharospirillum sp. MSK14-1]
MFSRHTLAIALAVSWLVLISLGFWWFQFRWIQDFDADNRILQSYPDLDQYVTELTDLLPAPASQEPITVTIVRANNCRCNRFSVDHLDDLAERYGDHTQFQYQQLAELPAPLRSLVPATPFAAIQTRQGELLYAGPINTGLECTSGSSLLESYLSRPDNAQLQLPLLARGCYCSV